MKKLFYNVMLTPHFFVYDCVAKGKTNQEISDLYNEFSTIANMTPEKVEEIKRSDFYKKLMSY